ncbi:hypothetical protein COLO4_19161 [Corchorus olitorius]|uniref:TF-B3 domain-containing protein n=1 Tax=Corchorus olitorius TaxID=93759 RepID=A0A1R3J6F9_9ROSI|nr:hypothetical protein COLO4_19161 [Corchorus olitorius]
MNANMPLNTSLIDVLQSTTQATLHMKDGRIEICDGWTMFYEGHGLRRRDMLYFTMFEATLHMKDGRIEICDGWTMF